MREFKKNKSLKFEIKTAFECDVDNAFKTITNPLKYPEIHPFITRVEKIDENRFECYETTSIFGIPYSFKYVVVINYMNSNKVVMLSEVQKGVWITLSFSTEYFQEEQFLCEEIEIEASYLVQKILSQKLKKAHHMMLHKIKQEIYMNS